MRVLLTAFGSRGDVQPLLALGLGLRDRGHEVTVGAAPNYRVWVEGLGLVFHEIGGDFEPWLKEQSARNPFSVLGSLAAYLRDEVPVCFEQTRAAAREADLVVTTIHLASQSAAEVLGVPCRTILYTPALLPSRSHPPVAIPPQNLPGWVNGALWWTVGRIFDLLFKRPVNRERAKLGLEPVREYLTHARGARPILAADKQFAPIPPDVDSDVIQTGALVMRDPGPLEAEVEHFLQEGAPPVYVGFGSTPDTSPEETLRLLVDGVCAAGRRAIVSGGWAGLGSDGLPPGIFGIRECPHALLLPRVAVTVHHGGAGTTAAALRAGVPQVIIPHLGDQFFHARRIRDLGIGLSIPRGRLTGARLAAAIQRLLGEPSYRSRARELADSLRDADGVDSAVAALMMGECQSGRGQGAETAQPEVT
jgi:vancomycin aglycone glucosyltransferase